MTPHCRYSRDYGAARIGAQLAADAHLRRFPHHVIVRYEKTVVEIFQRHPDQLTLPAGSGEVPF